MDLILFSPGFTRNISLASGRFTTHLTWCEKKHQGADCAAKLPRGPAPRQTGMHHGCLRCQHHQKVFLSDWNICSGKQLSQFLEQFPCLLIVLCHTGCRASNAHAFCDLPFDKFSFARKVSALLCYGMEAFHCIGNISVSHLSKMKGTVPSSITIEACLRGHFQHINRVFYVFGLAQHSCLFWWLLYSTHCWQNIPARVFYKLLSDNSDGLRAMRNIGWPAFIRAGNQQLTASSEAGQIAACLACRKFAEGISQSAETPSQNRKQNRALTMQREYSSLEKACSCENRSLHSRSCWLHETDQEVLSLYIPKKIRKHHAEWNPTCRDEWTARIVSQEVSLPQAVHGNTTNYKQNYGFPFNSSKHLNGKWHQQAVMLPWWPIVLLGLHVKQQILEAKPSISRVENYLACFQNWPFDLLVFLPVQGIECSSNSKKENVCTDSSSVCWRGTQPSGVHGFSCVSSCKLKQTPICLAVQVLVYWVCFQFSRHWDHHLMATLCHSHTCSLQWQISASSSLSLPA